MSQVRHDVLSEGCSVLQGRKEGTPPWHTSSVGLTPRSQRKKTTWENKGKGSTPQWSQMKKKRKEDFCGGGVHVFLICILVTQWDPASQQGYHVMIAKGSRLSGVIRANRFKRFARIGRTRYKNNGFMIRANRFAQIALRTARATTQKNPRAHKNQIGTSPPKPKIPPPKKRGILWT